MPKALAASATRISLQIDCHWAHGPGRGCSGTSGPKTSSFWIPYRPTKSESAIERLHVRRSSGVLRMLFFRKPRLKSGFPRGIQHRYSCREVSLFLSSSVVVWSIKAFDPIAMHLLHAHQNTRPFSNRLMRGAATAGSLSGENITL